MNLTISGHHLDVTPALRAYVKNKLDRITRHCDQLLDIKVLLSVEKQKEKDKRQRAECTLRLRGQDLFAQACHQDMYAAIDLLMDKLDRMVGRHMERVQDPQPGMQRRFAGEMAQEAFTLNS